MTDWHWEIEGVICDIEARQVNKVDVRTLRRVQEEIKQLQASMKRAINGLNGALDAPGIKWTPGVIHAQMVGAVLDLEESLGSDSAPISTEGKTDG